VESWLRGVVGPVFDDAGGVALDFMGVLVVVLADFRGERRIVGIVEQVFGVGDCWLLGGMSTKRALGGPISVRVQRK